MLNDVANGTCEMVQGGIVESSPSRALMLMDTQGGPSSVVTPVRAEVGDNGVVPPSSAIASKSFAPFADLPPFPIGKETSLRNREVGIALMRGAPLHGDRVNLDLDASSLRRAADDLLASSAVVRT